MEERRRRPAGGGRSRRRRARRAALAGVLLGAFLIPPESGAFSSGVTGKARSGCGSCHGPVPSPNAAVALVPTPAGSGFDLEVTVEDASVPPSGTGARGGFDLNAPFGALSAKDAAVKVIGRDATHAGAAGNRQRAWTVHWEPSPPSVCDPVFYVAANAVNGDSRATDADHWNVATATASLTEGADSPGPKNLRFTRPAPRTFAVNSISLGLPAEATIVAGNAVVLEASVQDETGISAVEFFDVGPLGGEPVPLGGEVVSADSEGIRARTEWNALLAAPGPHTLIVEATDCGGKRASATLEVLVL